MKRKIVFVLFLFLLVGCKSKDLSCTKMSIDTDEVKLEEGIVLKFKKKEPVEGVFYLNYYFAKDIDNNSQITRNSLEDQFSIYKESKGIEYFFSTLDQGIHFELQANISKLTEEEKNNLENITKYSNYNEARESLAKDGYHCK